MSGAKPLGPQDVGHRVVVRRIVGIRANRPIFSDTLGRLISLDEDALTVRTATGLVEIPLAVVARAKRIPPRIRANAAEVVALERAADRAWPAAETVPLGDWLLRATGGWTNRANSALAIGNPGRDPVPFIADWYAERRLPPRITVPLPLSRAVVDRLAGEPGWRPQPTVLVQAADLAGLAGGPVDGVALDPAPAEDWLRLIAGRKGTLPPAAYGVLTGPAQVRFAAVRVGGELLAAARGAVTDDRLHLGLLEVAGPARRQGLGSRVVRALAGWAADLGAHTAYLQVEESNTPARSLYERLGFHPHHTYVTWIVD